jgi:hypothetical protein
MTADARPSRRRREAPDPQVAAEHLRERVYGTVSVLASIATLLGARHDEGAVTAAVTLAVTVGALWAASLFADLTAHLAIHQSGPGRAELRRLLSSHREILAAAGLPVLLVLSTETGWWELETALRWAAGGQVLTLALVGFLAVRGTAIPFWGRVVVIAGEVALGLAIVGIKVLTH